MAYNELTAFACGIFLLSLLLSFHGMKTGGIRKIDLSNPNDRDDRDIVEKGIEDMLLKNGGNYQVVCDSLSASVQVVEGALYRVAMEVTPGEEGDAIGAVRQKCIGQEDMLDFSAIKFCCFTIWSRSWLKPQNLDFEVEGNCTAISEIPNFHLNKSSDLCVSGKLSLKISG